MRVVIQRVNHAKVEINAKIHNEIKIGLLVLAGFEESDSVEDLEWTIGKILKLRIFPDENKVMNLSLTDIQGELLLVSQFTLHASTQKGNRPSYIKAARPEIAIPLYEKCIELMEQQIPGKLKTGAFGADMQITLCNDGPVTIIIDSKKRE